MKESGNSRLTWSALHRATAVLLLVHLLAIVAMAVSPALHEWVHGDADHEDHQCAATLFASGNAADQVGSPTVLAAVCLPWIGMLQPEIAREVFHARVDGRIRERAPPLGAV